MTEKRRLTRLTRMRYHKEAPLLLTWYIKLKGLYQLIKKL